MKGQCFPEKGKGKKRLSIGSNSKLLVIRAIYSLYFCTISGTTHRTLTGTVGTKSIHRVNNTNG